MASIKAIIIDFHPGEDLLTVNGEGYKIYSLLMEHLHTEKYSIVEFLDNYLLNEAEEQEFRHWLTLYKSGQSLPNIIINNILISNIPSLENSSDSEESVSLYESQSYFYLDELLNGFEEGVSQQFQQAHAEELYLWNDVSKTLVNDEISYLKQYIECITSNPHSEIKDIKQLISEYRHKKYQDSHCITRTIFQRTAEENYLQLLHQLRYSSKTNQSALRELLVKRKFLIKLFSLPLSLLDLDEFIQSVQRCTDINLIDRIYKILEESPEPLELNLLRIFFIAVSLDKDKFQKIMSKHEKQHTTIEHKVEKLKAAYAFSLDTHTIFFVDLSREQTDLINLANIYLEQHKNEQPTFVTNHEEFEGAISKAKQAKLQIIICGQYDTGLEISSFGDSMYFAKQIPNERKSPEYFASIINKYSNIRKVRIIGCSIARLKDAFSVERQPPEAKHTFKSDNPDINIEDNHFVTAMNKLITRTNPVIIKAETVSWGVSEKSKTPFLENTKKPRSVQFSTHSYRAIRESLSVAEKKTILSLAENVNKYFKPYNHIDEMSAKKILDDLKKIYCHQYDYFIYVKTAHYRHLDKFETIEQIIEELNKHVLQVGANLANRVVLS